MARKIEVEIVGDASSLNKAFGTAQSASGKLGSAFKALTIAGVSAAGGLAVAGVKMIGLASDAAEVDSKLKVVFGNRLPKLKANLDAFSKSTGASRYELRQQAADMGALLKPMLGSVGATQKMSLATVKLATDLSSFNNVPVGDALESIRAGLVGESEPLRRFGILINEAAVKTEAYRAGIAKQGAELTEAQKVQARYNLIMQQSKQAQGDATRTAGSMANQLRALKNSVTDTATDIGTALLPAALSFVHFATGSVIPTVKTLASGFIDSVGPAVRDVATAFAAAGPGIMNVLTPIWQTVQSNLAPILEKLKDIGVAAITAIGNVLHANGPQIRQIFENLGTVIRNLASIIIPILRVALAVILPAAIRILIPVLQAVTVVLAAASAAVRTLAGVITTILVGAVSVAISAARAIGEGIRNGIINPVKTIDEKVRAALGELWGALRGLVTRAYAAGRAIGSAVVSGVIDGLKGIASKAAGIVSDAISHLPKINIPGFSPIEHVGYAIGRMISDGMARGVREGNRTLTNQLKQTLGGAASETTKLARGLFKDPLRAAKQVADDWAASDGVDNMRGVGAMFGTSVMQGFRESLLGPGGSSGSPLGFGFQGGMRGAFIDDTAPGGIHGNVTPGRGTTINMSFPNYVGSKQEIADLMQRELLKINRRNTTLGFT